MSPLSVVPGRIRFESQDIIGQFTASEYLAREIEKLGGVLEACAVLIFEGRLTAIIDALLILGLAGALNPAASAFMHNATTVISALNSLRLLTGKDVRCKRQGGVRC